MIIYEYFSGGVIGGIVNTLACVVVLNQPLIRPIPSSPAHHLIRGVERENFEFNKSNFYSGGSLGVGM